MLIIYKVSRNICVKRRKAPGKAILFVSYLHRLHIVRSFLMKHHHFWHFKITNEKKTDKSSERMSTKRT